jgi:hypothetical protein
MQKILKDILVKVKILPSGMSDDNWLKTLNWIQIKVDNRKCDVSLLHRVGQCLHGHNFISTAINLGAKLLYVRRPSKI